MAAPDNLIYLDNAATSFPKPPEVGRAMAQFLSTRAVNPGRSGFDLSRETGLMVDRVRARIGSLFNNPARDHNRTIFTSNATTALNMALHGVLKEGDHVVATAADHNSVLRPLTMLARSGLITLDIAKCDAAGRVSPGDVDALIQPLTRLVVMTHASNVTGAIQPAADVGELCRQKEVLFLLDAAQTAGTLPVDMEGMNADLVAFTGHKSLLGPPGIGGLVVGPRIDPEPSQWGGTGVRSAELVHPAEFPWRLEAGTLNTVGIAGLEAGLDWIEEKGQDVLLEKERDLVERLVDGCRHEFPNMSLSARHMARDEALPVVSIYGDSIDPEKVGQFLDIDWNIAVRTGLHCAPLIHQHMSTHPEGTVRVSFGPFNTTDHVDRLLEALKAIAS